MGILFADFDCFLEFKAAGAQQCTPKCTQDWQRLQKKSPTCGKIFDDRTAQIYMLMRSATMTLANHAYDDNIGKAWRRMPTGRSTYSEVCIQGAPMFVV